MPNQQAVTGVTNVMDTALESHSGLAAANPSPTPAFDSVLVGTSPLVLIEAIRLGSSGKKVLLIDRQNRVGGAWYTTTLAGYSGLEMGCHYIERNDQAYRFLESIIGQPGAVMDPQPFRLWKGFQFDRASLAPYYLGVIEEILRDRDCSRLFGILHQRVLGPLFRLVQRRSGTANGQLDLDHLKELAVPSSPSVKLSELDIETRELSYRYPINGCQQLLDSLQTQIEKLNIEIRLGVTVDRIEIGKGSTTILHTTNGFVECTEVVVPSCSDLEVVNGENTLIEVQRENATQQLVILHIRGKKRRPFTYFEPALHTMLLRVSDIGAYSESFRENANTNELMICTHVTDVFWNESTNEEARASRTLTELVDIGIIAPNCELLNHWREQFTTTFLPEAELQVLEEAASPHVRTLYSFNLAISFEKYSLTTLEDGVD